uniref:Uncharacterized protein n=3 Tax=Physcomitrium patens TaxID=3218 RepID=A0A2K1JHC4_PHYPA|nr:GDSL esterase/lipase At5g37690-like [Physcomitrium patens]PNR40948.1 hypothetical protein PHYPA_018351 [Physcomitrium patens]|eukprot:XP_024394142.1 GDSL esterase/lipase At5g37690-like [Physcomitrella patens]
MELLQQICVRYALLTCMLLFCPFSSAAPANFVFGDSLVDIGNNNFLVLSLAKANLYPNGIDLGNGVPTGRFCNGRTVPDIIFEKLGVPIPKEYLNPTTRGSVILNGVNYASGAGGILDSTGSNYIQRLSFNKQLSYFQKTKEDITNMIGPQRTEKLLNDAIFVVVFGSNDYINNYLLTNSATSQQYTPSKYQDLLISTFHGQLSTLHNLGARKFVVTDLGPLGCLPSQIVRNNTVGTCLDYINDYAKNYNAALKPMLNQLTSALPGSIFCYGEVNAAIQQFITNRPNYGFDVINAGCCGLGPLNGQLGCLPGANLCTNRINHLFWDPFHPTDSANAILAERFFSGGPDAISPYNIQQLVSM